MSHKPFKRSRRAPTRDPARTYYLFCEGTNTEPGYFLALQKVVRQANIVLQTFPGSGDPKNLSAAAIAHYKSLKRRQKRESWLKDDEVWAIFDRDSFDYYYVAVQKCADNGLKIANSNPCFELWLILHVEDYDKADDRYAVMARLAEIRPDYNTSKKTLNFDDIILSVEDAENRSEVLLARRVREQSGKWLNPPYTKVFELTRAIRKAAGLIT